MTDIDVISLSGGRTSGFMGEKFLDNKRGRPAEFVYCDTGFEHPKTYDFLRAIRDNWGIQITCLKSIIQPEMNKGVLYSVEDLDNAKFDLTLFREMILKYSTPDIINKYCTDRLKTTVCYKYCNDKYGKGNYIRWLGMRIDEPDRIKKATFQIDMFAKETKETVNIKYLAEISSATKQNVNDWWSEQPFDLEIPDYLGNCIFCIKKGTSKLAMAARKEPEAARQFIEMVEAPEVRPKPSHPEIPTNVMYRGNHSLRSIIEMYKDVSDDELERIIFRNEDLDGSDCANSCEAIVPAAEFFLEMQDDG